MIRERGEKKKGMALPFVIFGKQAVETRWGKRQSWSTQRELHVGIRNYRFFHVPKGRGFFYIGYFLSSGLIRAILVQS